MRILLFPQENQIIAITATADGGYLNKKTDGSSGPSEARSIRSCLGRQVTPFKSKEEMLHIADFDRWEMGLGRNQQINSSLFLLTSKL